MENSIEYAVCESVTVFFCFRFNYGIENAPFTVEQKPLKVYRINEKTHV